MAKKVSWRKVTTIYSFKDAKTVRVFGIARVTTDKQAQKIGESLEHQKEVLNNWVRSKSSLHSTPRMETC
jgi:ribosome-binding factor A